MGGNHVENNATLWPNLQNCKISSRVEIPKLDPSVAIFGRMFFSSPANNNTDQGHFLLTGFVQQSGQGEIVLWVRGD